MLGSLAAATLGWDQTLSSTVCTKMRPQPHASTACVMQRQPDCALDSISSTDAHAQQAPRSRLCLCTCKAHQDRGAVRLCSSCSDVQDARTTQVLCMRQSCSRRLCSGYCTTRVCQEPWDCACSCTALDPAQMQHTNRATAICKPEYVRAQLDSILSLMRPASAQAQLTTASATLGIIQAIIEPGMHPGCACDSAALGASLCLQATTPAAALQG